MFLSESDRKAVAPILLRGKIICGALAVGELLYLVLAVILRAQGLIPEGGLVDVRAARWALAVAGPAALAAGFFV